MPLAPPPGETVTAQNCRAGSRARVDTLQFLALRPEGVDTLGVAHHLHLDAGETRQVLYALRADQRIACERDAHGTITWYIPRVRAQQGRKGWR